MIAGLALAPASRPVTAATSGHTAMQAMADEMASAAMMDDSMDEMAGAMPCCPSKAPAPVDCDKCVFMAGCMSFGFAALSATIVHPIPIVSDAIALQRNDSRPDGLGHPPPEHPPRMLV
jgi:CheY-like chemotaxis protein